MQPRHIDLPKPFPEEEHLFFPNRPTTSEEAEVLMRRREFFTRVPRVALGGVIPLAFSSAVLGKEKAGSSAASGESPLSGLAKPRDFQEGPFKRLVIMGESTVQGGPWLQRQEDRFADVLVGLINACQEKPVDYHNKGIGANAISPRSPGYAESTKPSALERYKTDVIDLNPDLFILCYGLNDMRAAMPVEDFRDDMATILRDVKKACAPLTLLTTVYYMTSWRSFPPCDKGSVGLTMRYNDCIRGLASEFDCILADVWGAEGGADWLIHYDGVHANRVGNMLIGHRIFEAIAQHSSGLTNQAFQQGRDTEWSRETMRMRAQAGDPFKKTW
jgi:lysophospholipase L1-like esterase